MNPNHLRRMSVVLLTGGGLWLAGFAVLGHARTFNIFEAAPAPSTPATQPMRWGVRGATVLPRAEGPVPSRPRAEPGRQVSFRPWRPAPDALEGESAPDAVVLPDTPTVATGPAPGSGPEAFPAQAPAPAQAPGSAPAPGTDLRGPAHPGPPATGPVPDQVLAGTSMEADPAAGARSAPHAPPQPELPDPPRTVRPLMPHPTLGLMDQAIAAASEVPLVGRTLPVPAAHARGSGPSGSHRIVMPGMPPGSPDSAPSGAVAHEPAPGPGSDPAAATGAAWAGPRWSTVDPGAVSPVLLARFRSGGSRPALQLAQATGEADPDIGSDAGPGGDMVRVDFKEMDLRSVIQLIYDQLGINYMIDEQVKGTVTVLGRRSVTPGEAEFLLKSILEFYGFGTQRVDGVLRVIPKKGATGQLIPLRTGIPESHRSPDPLVDPERLVLQYYTIQHVPAAEIQKIILALTGNQANIIPYPPTNSLLIADSEASLRRVTEIVDLLDQPIEGRVVVPVPIHHTRASEVAKKVGEVLAKRDEGLPDLGTMQGKLAKPVLLPDDRTNTLAVIALERQVKEIVDLVELVDRDDVWTPITRVIHLQNADAEQVAGQLGQAFQIAGGGEGAPPYSVVADPRTQSLIVTATAGSVLAKLEELIQFLDTAAIPADGVTIHHYAMKFSDATKVKEVLSPLEQGAEGETPAKIIADETTNSLVVISSKSKYQEILSILKNLDTLRPQVMVEVLVVDFSLDRSKNIGADLNIIPLDDGEARGFLLGSTGAIRSGLLGGPSPGAHIGVLADGTFDASQLTSTNPDFTELSKITYLINLFKSDNRANILQAPRIFTADNVLAKINVGEKVQVPTGLSLVQQPGQIPFTNFSTEELGLLLEITPRITKNDFVALKVKIEIKNRTGDVLNFGQFQTPVFTKTAIETEVTVKDHTTLAIGGLIREDKQKQVQKIPILGDIPVLGRLFQNRTTSSEKRDLMVFMTPTIVRDAFMAREVTRREETVLNYRDLPSHTLPHRLGRDITARTLTTDLLMGKTKGP